MTPTARLGAGAVLTACLLAAAPASAQEQPARYPFAGTAVFRNLLGKAPNNLKPVETVGPGGALPRETILIVLGDPRGLDEAARRVGGLARFRHEGGAILIATDQPDRGRLAELRLSVSGRRVSVIPQLLEGRPDLACAGNRECPVLRVFEAPQHSVFRRLGALVTNRPSYLVPGQGCDLRLLAEFPEGCIAEGQGWRQELPFILGTEGGEDRILVLADHDVFLDGMMMRTSTHNFEFAADCIRWLADKGRRKYALLIEHGRVETDFNPPLVKLPPLPLPPLKAVGKLVRGLEEANVFNAAILEGVPRGLILRYLFLVVSGWVLAYGLGRLVRAHHRAEPVSRVAAKVERRADPDLPLVARRTEASARAGNCYEAARDLARLCFEGDSGEPSPTPPAVVGGRRLRREVERLWRLAYGATPTPVSPKEFAALAAAVGRVRAALGQ
jgi:hypothetical protein